MKKFYPLLILIVSAGFLTQRMQAQCDLKVNIESIPSSTICLGETVDLLVTSNLVAPVPTVCAITPDKSCGLGADSLKISVGNGSQVNNYGQNPPELFGDFGEAQSKSQLIYLASELKARGFKGGKITSLAFDIARIDVGRNPNIHSLTLRMGCTGNSGFTGSFVSGLLEVFSPKPQALVTGYNTFLFDKAFEWDGESNIVVEVCIYTPAGTPFSTANWGSFTRDTIPGFTCWRQSTSATSNGDCSFTGTEKNYNQRPNTRFGICSPKNINLLYSWTPNNGTLSSLSAARPTASPVVNTRYSVVVSRADVPGCQDKDSIDITVVDPGNFTLTSNAPVCTGSTLKLFANTNGISFSWVGPNNFSSFDKDPVISNATVAATGTYTLLVDNGVCKTTKSINVVVQPTPLTGLAKDSTICRSLVSLSLPGLLTGEDPGGTWTDNSNSGILTGSTINPIQLNNALLPATYTYTYQLSNVCGTFSSSVKVTVAATRSAGIPDDTLLCETSAPVNLFKVLDGNPDAGGTWTDNNNTGQSTPNGILNPANLGGGIYTFTYTVPGNSPCPNTSAVVTVNVSNQPEAGTGISAEACVNTVVNLFPFLSGANAGGTWSDMDNSGGVLNVSTGSLNTASIQPGTYRFKYKITAALPCISDSAVVSLKINGIPKIKSNLPVCAPDKMTFTVQLELEGGDPGTYQVSPAGTISGTSPKIYTSPAFADGSSVLFTLTDGKGCGSSSVTVKKRCACPTEAGTMKQNGPLKVCNNGTAVAEYNGGFVNDDDDTLSFVLHTKAGTSLGTVLQIRSTPSFGYVNGIVYGQTYYISAVAGNKKADNLVDLTDECLAVAAGVPVVFGAVGTPSLSFSKNPVCPGENITLTAMVSGSPSFRWSGPAGFTGNQNPVTVSNIADINAGTYILTVEEYGCQATTTGNLVVIPKPVVSITSDAVICQGSTGQLRINVGSSSQVSVTFGISTGGTQQVALNPGMNFITVNPAATTTYNLLSVSYINGCSYALTGSTTMQVVTAPELSYQVIGDSAFCAGDSKTGRLEFSFEGNASLNIFYQFNNLSQSLTNVADGDQLTLLAALPGANTFKIDSITISNGNCTFQNVYRPVVFYNLATPVVVASVNTDKVCQNDSIQLSLKVVASAPVTVAYEVNSSSFSIVTDKDTTIRVPIAQNSTLLMKAVSYVMKPSCGSPLLQSFLIGTKPVPVFTPEVTPATCNNTATGSIVVNTLNLTDLFRLDNGLFGTNRNYSNLLPGDYTVEALGLNGCTSRITSHVGSLSNLLFEANAVSTSCAEENGRVTVDIQSGISPYEIFLNGIEQQNADITGLPAGSYEVLVKDHYDCVSSKTVVILPSTKVSFSVTDNSPIDCNSPELGKILVSAIGGSGVYQYKVSGWGFQGDSVFNGLFPQVYHVTVTDDRGCESTREIRLTAKQKFNISLTVRKPLLCFESTDAQILVSTQGAESQLLYSRDAHNYQADPLIQNLGPGTAEIYVREMTGCRREQVVSFAVTRPTPIDLEILSSGNPRCWNSSDGFVLLNATGGAYPDKQFSIDGGEHFQDAPDFLDIAKGEYILIARNKNNCYSDTIRFEITEPSEIEINPVFHFNEDQSFANLEIVATGGTGNLFYSIDGTNFYTSSNFSGLAPGTYTVFVKDNNNCTASRTVVISGVGIDEKEAVGMMVFPNPLAEELQIVPDRELTSVKLQISDATGRVVYFRELESLHHPGISIRMPDDIAPGLYSLVMQSEQGVFSRLLIKK